VIMGLVSGGKAGFKRGTARFEERGV
jgi:hypothetical protein